jgi:hypothetical protein
MVRLEGLKSLLFLATNKVSLREKQKWGLFWEVLKMIFLLNLINLI